MKRKFLLGTLFIAALGFTTVSCSDSSEENGDNSQITNPGGGNGGGEQPQTTRYQHRVLLEDITGTWCPACPIASSAINQAKANAANGEKVVAAAIHIGQPSYPDPMQIEAGMNLYQNFFVPNYGEGGSFYFPTVTINRGAEAWTQQGIAQFFNAINQQGSPVGIKISSNLTNTGGTVTANFKFSEGYQNLKYSIYIVENNVRTNSAQAGTNEGTNYVHNDVLRAISGTPTGNALGAVTAGQEITKDNQTVSYTLFNNDLSKVEVVVFVTDASGKVLNVRSAHANQSVDYEVVAE